MVRKILTLVAVLTYALMPLTFAVGSGYVYAQDDYLDETFDELDSQDYWDTTYDYDYDYYYDEELSPEAAAAFLAAYGLFFGCFFIISIVYMGLTLSTIAKKLGVEDRWMAWVPIINYFYMVRLAGMNSLLALLFFVPMVNIVIMIMVMMKIAERRGFESWLGVLILVPVVNFFLPAYLAWGEPSGSKPAAPSQPSTPPAPTSGDTVEQS